MYSDKTFDVYSICEQTLLGFSCLADFFLLWMFIKSRKSIDIHDIIDKVCKSFHKLLPAFMFLVLNPSIPD